MTWQCFLRAANPVRQIILSYFSSIRSAKAQNARSSSLIWYSSTAATMFMPCTYQASGSYTLYSCSTPRSIFLQLWLIENVGHLEYVRGRSFSICSMITGLGFYFLRLLQSTLFLGMQDLVHSSLHRHGCHEQVQPWIPSPFSNPQKLKYFDMPSMGLMSSQSMDSLLTSSSARLEADSMVSVSLVLLILWSQLILRFGFNSMVFLVVSQLDEIRGLGLEGAPSLDQAHEQEVLGASKWVINPQLVFWQ